MKPATALALVLAVGAAASVSVAVVRALRRQGLPLPAGGAVSATQTPNEWAHAEGIDPRLVHAFIRVESGNLQPVGPRGPIIRLEVHHLRNRLPASARADVDRYFRITNPSAPWINQEWRPTGQGAWRPLHTGAQNNEYDAFDIARRIANAHGAGDVPYEVVSIGIGQILGRHYKTLGYPSASAMWVDAHTLEGQQRQLVGFLAADARIVAALRRGDLHTAGAIYNAGTPTPSAAQAAQVAAYVAKLENAAGVRSMA